MNEIEGTGIVILLFALRCILPIALTIGIGYMMNRMVDKWEREAAAAREAENMPQPESVTPPASIPVPAMTGPSLAKEKRPSIALPCWVTRGCDPAQRSNCAAFKERGKPCWVARMTTEGIMPANCPTCPVYQQAHA